MEDKKILVSVEKPKGIEVEVHVKVRLPKRVAEDAEQRKQQLRLPQDEEYAGERLCCAQCVG